MIWFCGDRDATLKYEPDRPLGLQPSSAYSMSLAGTVISSSENIGVLAVTTRFRDNDQPRPSGLLSEPLLEGVSGRLIRSFFIL